MPQTYRSSKLLYAEMVFPQPVSSTHISTSSPVYGLGIGLLPAQADPDHGWKSDVGCGAAF
jgi:hypothetical protein